MRTLKAGVIGTGFIGPAHIEALRRVPGVEVYAVASNEPERAKALAEQYGIAKVYDRWEEVVRDPEVEVVHNCTPNNLHFAINRAAVRAGKHIVSEKPLTMTAKESAELVRMAASAGVVNAVNFNYRFYPLVQHARSMVSSGQLGDVFLVHGHYLQDWLYYDTDYNWRLDPSISGASRAVADIGSHWCDLVQFVTGRAIVRVCASLSIVHARRKKPVDAVVTFKGTKQNPAAGETTIRITTEDAGVVMFEMDGGARGAFTVSQVSAGRKNREWFEIDGSKLALSWDQEEPNCLWIGHRGQANEILIKDPLLLHESARRYAHYPGGHPEGYPDGPKNLFANVYAFIRGGADPRNGKPDFPTFVDGHAENLIVEAVLRSNKTRRWVDVQ
jgi:predicted dehydrogenase